VAFAVLLTVTYLSLLPWSFKLWLLAVVYLFTVLIPWVGVMLYRKAHGWSTAELSRRHRRFVPYLLHIVSYLCCFSIIENVHMPAFAGALIVASLMLQCGCTIINIWWKISMHSAAAGAAVGALVAYSLLLNYNPVWWLCLLLLLSGCVMSSRMVLLQHTLAQVLCGFGFGILCGFVGIILS
jgi:membrane-associated phospholipid phosphatase